VSKKKEDFQICSFLPDFINGDYGRYYQKTVYLGNNSFWFRSIDAFCHFHTPHPRYRRDYERRK